MAWIALLTEKTCPYKVDRHIVIDVPPLRERGRDIVLLIEHFNQKLSANFDRLPLNIDPEAMTALQNYRWPGNVRELRNTIERLLLLHKGNRVSIDDLPDEISHPEASDLMFGSSPRTAPVNMDLHGIESVAIQQAIEQEKGNLTKVASSLGISRPTLYRKINLYGLDRGK